MEQQDESNTTIICYEDITGTIIIEQTIKIIIAMGAESLR